MIMDIIYAIITLLALFFVLRAIVHSRRTHFIASKMNRHFEHYYNEDAYHNDIASKD